MAAVIELRKVNPRTGAEWTWYDRELRHDCPCLTCRTSTPGFAWTNDCWPRRALHPTDVDGPRQGPILTSFVEMGGLFGCSRWFLFEFKSEHAVKLFEGQRDALRRLQAANRSTMTLIEINATSPTEADVHLVPFAGHGYDGHVDIHWMRSWLHQAAQAAADIERQLRKGA